VRELCRRGREHSATSFGQGGRMVGGASPCGEKGLERSRPFCHSATNVCAPSSCGRLNRVGQNVHRSQVVLVCLRFPGRVPESPQRFSAGTLAREKFGKVFAPDCGFQLFVNDPDKVRFPDASFLAQGRRPEVMTPEEFRNKIQAVPALTLRQGRALPLARPDPRSAQVGGVLRHRPPSRATGRCSATKVRTGFA
jgi:hypothetical protein